MSDLRAYYNPNTGRIHYLTNDGGPPNDGRPPREAGREQDHASTQQPLQGSHMPPSRPPPARHVRFDFGTGNRHGPPPPYDSNRWSNPQEQAQAPHHRTGQQVHQMPVWVHHPAGHGQTQPTSGHGVQHGGGGDGQGQTIWVPLTVPDPPVRRYVTRDGGPPDQGRPPSTGNGGGCGHCGRS
jgi:hypothetical protein